MTGDVNQQIFGWLDNERITWNTGNHWYRKGRSIILVDKKVLASFLELFGRSYLQNLSKLSGSYHQILSEFVKITRVKNRNNAEWLLEKEGWNLDSAIAWFYEHKDDDEEKKYFETEIEDDTEEQGKFLILI